MLWSRPSPVRQDCFPKLGKQFAILLIYKLNPLRPLLLPLRPAGCIGCGFGETFRFRAFAIIANPRVLIGPIGRLRKQDLVQHLAARGDVDQLGGFRPNFGRKPQSCLSLSRTPGPLPLLSMKMTPAASSAARMAWTVRSFNGSPFSNLVIVLVETWAASANSLTPN